MKSPLGVAVEKAAKDIASGGYNKEELRKQILGFILENRMCKSVALFKELNVHHQPACSKELGSEEVDDQVSCFPTLCAHILC